MNSQTDLSQQELLFKLIKLANRRLIKHYNNNSFTDICRRAEEVKEILEILDLAVNEIDRLTYEE